MQLNYILANQPNTTVTLFNNEEEQAIVAQRIAGGSKKGERKVHDDIAQKRVNEQVKDGTVKLIPV